MAVRMGPVGAKRNTHQPPKLQGTLPRRAMKRRDQQHGMLHKYSAQLHGAAQAGGVYGEMFAGWRARPGAWPDERHGVGGPSPCPP